MGWSDGEVIKIVDPTLGGPEHYLRWWWMSKQSQQSRHAWTCVAECGDELHWWPEHQKKAILWTHQIVALLRLTTLLRALICIQMVQREFRINNWTLQMVVLCMYGLCARWRQIQNPRQWYRQLSRHLSHQWCYWSSLRPNPWWFRQLRLQRHHRNHQLLLIQLLLLLEDLQNNHFQWYLIDLDPSRMVTMMSRVNKYQ